MRDLYKYKSTFSSQKVFHHIFSNLWLELTVIPKGECSFGPRFKLRVRVPHTDCRVRVCSPGLGFEDFQRVEILEHTFNVLLGLGSRVKVRTKG